MATDPTRKSDDSLTLVDDAEVARAATYPHLVVRIYSAVYQRENIVIQHTLRVPIAQIGHKCSLVLHTEPFNADGTVSAACRRFLINSVQDAVSRLKFPMCVVWEPASCTFVKFNSAPLDPTEPPSGGLTLLRKTASLEAVKGVSGGGGGNRTRVRKSSTASSTYLAWLFDFAAGTPTGKLARGESP